MTLLKASDVTVYAIGFLEQPAAAARPTQQLDAAADGRGNRRPGVLPVAMKEVEEVYDKVLAEISGQYTLGYISTNTATDGAWRKVEIKVTRRRARVRTRKGYFAPCRSRKRLICRR